MPHGVSAAGVLAGLVLATACACPGLADPPGVEGRFTIRFALDPRHICGVIGPCPVGTYYVEVGGREILHALTVEFAPGTRDADRHLIEGLRFRDVSETIAVDGEARLPREHGAIVIQVRHVEIEPRP